LYRYIDAHIKFLWYAATVSIDAISSIFLFNEVICKVGPIEKVMSDQGGCFEADVFRHLCRLIGSDKLRSSAFHPSGNGDIEVVNKVIKPNLAKFVNSTHDDWDLHLGLAVNSYNNTVQSSIGMAPAEALFNRPPVLMADVICNNRLPSNTNIDNVSDYTLQLWKNAQRIRQDLVFNKELAQEKQRANYDKSVRDSRSFGVGDMVKIKNFKKSPNTCAAFVEKFIGPFKILRKLSELSYEIGAEDVKNQVVHYNRLLPYYTRDVLELPTSDLLTEADLEQVERPRDGMVNNLNNLSMVVCCYKKKLRRTDARHLLIDMENQLERPLNNLGIGSHSSATSFNSAEDNTGLLEAAENIGGKVNGDGEVANVATVIKNTREVTAEEWLILESVVLAM
jgi:hypothetical protein